MPYRDSVFISLVACFTRGAQFAVEHLQVCDWLALFSCLIQIAGRLLEARRFGFKVFPVFLDSITRLAWRFV
jgi:hypothetical protein